MDIHALLKEAVQKEASDFHVVVGLPPSFRVHGDLWIKPAAPITPEESMEALFGLLQPEQLMHLQKTWELNFALALTGLGRFRVNIYYSKGNVEAAFRVISVAPKTIQELGLPTVVADLSRRPSGLVLLTGAAGQGKTTTMAAMIHLVNHNERRLRIVTIEDPIEYLHTNKNSVIIQREVGIDTKSFSDALVQSLRQDPNIICIGEIRDLETISTALTAAETGHLVLATLHTPDAAQCIDRIIDIFPSHQQEQIRVQLASCLEGIIAQKLLPTRDGKGRVVAVEVLIATSAIRNLIREARTEQIYGMMQTGSNVGMKLMDERLKELYEKDIISYQTAISRARDPKSIKEDAD
jgi:twitching motility protein PilT